jgi:hypothetical protein
MSLKMPPTDTNADNDWASWARVVITTLDRYEAQIGKLFTLVDASKTESRDEMEGIRDRIRKELETARTEFLNAVMAQGKLFTDSISKQNMEWMAQMEAQKTITNGHYTAHAVAIAELKKEVELKAGVWGAIAGLIPAALLLLIEHLKKGG